jgi:hypothetical protein
MVLALTVSNFHKLNQNKVENPDDKFKKTTSAGLLFPTMQKWN